MILDIALYDLAESKSEIARRLAKKKGGADVLRIKIKKGGKPSIILLTLALFALWVSNVVDNLYVDAVAVLFTMSVIAAEVTEVFLNWKERRRGDK
ncbi:hypothetical protein V7024_02220 [Bacillus sp. JJ864]|uniref:hypothetical protein n=1 Tax=Bacillus sp. JJ864 TaxID=3122975 RepID=UPI00300003AA